MNYQQIVDDYLEMYRENEMFELGNSIDIAKKFFHRYFESRIKSYESVEKATNFEEAAKAIHQYELFAFEHFPLISDDKEIESGLRRLFYLLRLFVYETNRFDDNSDVYDVKLKWEVIKKNPPTSQSVIEDE